MTDSATAEADRQDQDEGQGKEQAQTSLLGGQPGEGAAAAAAESGDGQNQAEQASESRDGNGEQPRAPLPGELTIKAPDDAALPEDHEPILQQDSEQGQALRQWAADNGLTQDQLSQLVGIVEREAAQQDATAAKQAEEQLAQEKARLGPNAEQRLAQVDRFLGQNLTKEQYDAVTSNLGNSADAIAAVEALIEAAGGPKTAQQPGLAQPQQTPSEDELRQMVRDPRYHRDKDPAFIQRVQDGFRLLYGEA